MGGNQGKHGPPDHPSSTVHLRDKKDLAGVGIVFRKGHDGSLIVKDLIDGSGAEECKLIEAGDTLTQVDDIKISKISIAEVSGMILGEPGQPVRLKFTRTTGRSKRKYKVVLKRTVRATLEPTYRVQRDGINTRVTHIHLDCLQHQDAVAAENPGETPIVRDVLDACGNLVGPGLLEHARANRETILSPAPCPGVERLDSSHPAWPGNPPNERGAVSGKGGNLPNSKPKPTKRPAEPSQPSQPPLPPPPLPPAPADASPADDADLSVSQLLDGWASSSPGNTTSLSMGTLTTSLQVSLADSPAAASPEPPPPPPPEAPKAAAAAAAGFVPVAEPAAEEEEEAGGVGWEGLAESRIAIFEARQQQLLQQQGRRSARPVPPPPSSPA